MQSKVRWTGFCSYSFKDDHNGIYYFKSRKRFDFWPHPFDVGNILGLKRGYCNNHFLLKIYVIDNAEFEDYYTYHLNYFLSKGQGAEKEFLSYVWYRAETD